MTLVDPDSDRDMIARLRAGDPGAFDEVHGRFHARLFGFLVRLVRSRDVAEDLLAETWLRLVARGASLRPDTQIGPWLFTVARNLYVSYRRSRFLETGHAGDLLGLWPSGCHQPSPLEETAASETERRLESALALLPAAYREVLLLVGVEGLPTSEAAAICEVTPEALRQRLHRARMMLSDRLAQSTASGVTQVRVVLS